MQTCYKFVRNLSSHRTHIKNKFAANFPAICESDNTDNSINTTKYYRYSKQLTDKL